VSTRTRSMPRTLLAGAVALALLGGALAAVVAIDQPHSDEPRAIAPRAAPLPPGETLSDPAYAPVEIQPPPCVPDPTLAQPSTAPPPALAAALARFLADPRIAPYRTSVSVWMPTRGARPASLPVPAH
jgi:hypothetical protein